MGIAIFPTLMVRTIAARGPFQQGRKQRRLMELVALSIQRKWTCKLVKIDQPFSAQRFIMRL